MAPATRSNRVHKTQNRKPPESHLRRFTFLALAIAWKESHTLQLRWDVFNALNLTRLDLRTLICSIANTRSFRNYTGRLTHPRVMQFSLRCEFGPKPPAVYPGRRGKTPGPFFSLFRRNPSLTYAWVLS